MKAIVHYQIKENNRFKQGTITDIELEDAIAFAQKQKPGGVGIFVNNDLLLTFNNGVKTWENGSLFERICNSYEKQIAELGFFKGKRAGVRTSKPRKTSKARKAVKARKTKARKIAKPQTPQAQEVAQPVEIPMAEVARLADEMPKPLAPVVGA